MCVVRTVAAYGVLVDAWLPDMDRGPFTHETYAIFWGEVVG
jgi:hypothetical protein